MNHQLSHIPEVDQLHTELQRKGWRHFHTDTLAYAVLDTWFDDNNDLVYVLYGVGFYKIFRKPEVEHHYKIDLVNQVRRKASASNQSR